MSTEDLNKTDTAAEAPEKAPKAPGVGDVAKDLIRAGQTNEQVLAAVKEQFPEAKTSMASINWYRNKLRGDGEDVPTARELKAEEKAEEKAAKEQAKAEAKAAKLAEKQAAKEAKAAERAAAKEAKDAEKRAAKEAKAKKEAEQGKGAVVGGEQADDGQSFLE
jgi:septal ring factor EnvC (AmiA/AmiB activator)